MITDNRPNVSRYDMRRSDTLWDLAEERHKRLRRVHDAALALVTALDACQYAGDPILGDSDDMCGSLEWLASDIALRDVDACREEVEEEHAVARAGRR